MKKVILTLSALLAITTFVSAQYKPSEGFTAEVNFRPFNANPISINYLKARMFLSEKMAIRLGLSLNTTNSSTKVAGAALSDPIQETVNKFFVFGLYPGIEMHYGNYERLSPYFGAEINFEMKSASTTISNNGNIQNDKLECTGIWADNTNPAYTAVGFNLLTGVDFYVYKGLYMGAELGFGLSTFSFKEIKVSSTVAATSVTSTISTPGAKLSNFGVAFNPAIRLGWAF
ncbi:MAG: hypothetical protein HGB12_17605 [Bacteroidetes bacterium]|nr:hypothetical protein [Bacteroidota bacterium]